MSAFWIFAVVLTVAYLIYYCVIIAKDLARPREQVSSSEETFVLEKTAPEPSKVVEMTDKGFQVEDGSGNVREQEVTNVPAPGKPDSGKEDPGPLLDASGAPATPMAKKIVSAQEEMDPIDPDAASAMVLNGLKDAMTDENSTVDIEKTVTPPEKSSGDENAKKELDHDGGQRI